MSDGLSFVNLVAGDPAPWFHAATTANPNYAFDTAAGRYLVLCFFGSAGDAAAMGALRAVAERRDLFDDTHACFFGVSLDPEDRSRDRVRDSIPGVRYFWDFEGAVSRQYGALPTNGQPSSRSQVRRHWLVLSPSLRVMHAVAFAPDGSDVPAILDYLAALPPPDQHTGVVVQAPVLFLPDVFEPDFCRRLIGEYEGHGGEESGFMREVAGKTVGVHDAAHKRRKDHIIKDNAIIQATQTRVSRRIVPEIAKIHQFHVTRMERYIVGCYAAEDSGHFRAHRDNTTKGTAHRRFAVSINLNSDFDGGEIYFPEYGPRSFKPPPGGAVVFSCSLLHAVTRVTRGRRYAFLPFLYDDAAARLRSQNLEFLESAKQQEG